MHEIIWKDGYNETIEELNDRKLAVEGVAAVTVVPLKRAKASTEWPEWLAAIERERLAMKDIGTYTPISKSQLRKDDNILPMISILELKKEGRKKCRTVILGNRATDECETYASVAHWTTIRMLLQNALNKGQHICLADISNAFLNGPLEERVVVKPPEGWATPEQPYWLLRKAIYGLKQAPLAWKKELKRVLNKKGWVQTEHDDNVFRRGNNYVVCYVDDLLFLGDKAEVESAREEILSVYPGRKMDLVNNTFEFLGVTIEVQKDKMVFSQPELIKKILDKFNVKTKRSTPLSERVINTGALRPDYPIRAVVGALLFLATHSRNDISYSVQQLATCVNEPREGAVQACERVLAYVNYSQDLKMEMHKSDNLDLQCFSDSDFAMGAKRRSTTGYAIYCGGSLIQWKSILQRITTTSTYEAELVALTSAVKQLKWIRWLQKDLFDFEPKATEVVIKQLPNSSSTMPMSEVYCDNQAATKLVNNLDSSRTKLLDVRAHFVQCNVQRKQIKVSYVHTSLNRADAYTKPATKTQLREQLGHTGPPTLSLNETAIPKRLEVQFQGGVCW